MTSVMRYHGADLVAALLGWTPPDGIDVKTSVRFQTDRRG